MKISLSRPKLRFTERNARLDAWRELKRAVVRLGLSGDRRGKALARLLFKKLPELRGL